MFIPPSTILRISPSRAGEPRRTESMTIRSPRRAPVAGERDAGEAERADAPAVALLAVLPAPCFFPAPFFLAGVLLALAVAFFFAGMTPPEKSASLRLCPSTAGRRSGPDPPSMTRGKEGGDGRGGSGRA